MFVEKTAKIYAYPTVHEVQGAKWKIQSPCFWNDEDAELKAYTDLYKNTNGKVLASLDFTIEEASAYVMKYTDKLNGMQSIPFSYTPTVKIAMKVTADGVVPMTFPPVLANPRSAWGEKIKAKLEAMKNLQKTA